MREEQIQTILADLESGSAVEVFGESLPRDISFRIVKVIRNDIGEYSSDLFSSREQILTDAYLMSEIERLLIELTKLL